MLIFFIFSIDQATTLAIVVTMEQQKLHKNALLFLPSQHGWHKNFNKCVGGFQSCSIYASRDLESQSLVCRTFWILFGNFTPLPPPPPLFFLGNSTGTVAKGPLDQRNLYQLFGHKWFSSATDAQVAFTLARIVDLNGSVTKVTLKVFTLHAV